ncbi:hypothetical protein BDP27DRAFT_1339062 [Rhodocollybia butyracea]|uniref:Uncharacterized protein n=1 Tax=Rhodocollybia butyracea TaxID=206335 RepID=A0A9P5PC91_9AGAR|nr:hypothetical protein BDP27DRAFT_1339062 [Rhodocollybia butyracea]
MTRQRRDFLFIFPQHFWLWPDLASHSSPPSKCLNQFRRFPWPTTSDSNLLLSTFSHRTEMVIPLALPLHTYPTISDQNRQYVDSWSSHYPVDCTEHKPFEYDTATTEETRSWESERQYTSSSPLSAYSMSSFRSRSQSQAPRSSHRLCSASAHPHSASSTARMLKDIRHGRQSNKRRSKSVPTLISDSGPLPPPTSLPLPLIHFAYIHFSNPSTL